MSRIQWKSAIDQNLGQNMKKKALADWQEQLLHKRDTVKNTCMIIASNFSCNVSDVKIWEFVSNHPLSRTERERKRERERERDSLWGQLSELWPARREGTGTKPDFGTINNSMVISFHRTNRKAREKGKKKEVFFLPCNFFLSTSQITTQDKVTHYLWQIIPISSHVV